MRDNTQSVGSNGMGLGTILFLIFLVLKLTDNIDWSWWWVASPLWISASLSVAFLLVYFLILAVLLKRS